MAATVVLAAAVVITAATSYEDPRMVEELAGTPILLTPDDPVATIPVTFSATPEALRGAPFVTFEVFSAVVWETVEDTAERVVVELAPQDASRVIEGAPCPAGGCVARCSGRACVTSYDLIFRWPDHLEAGSARVEWSVEGTFEWTDDRSWGSPDYPLEGSELSFVLGEVSGGATPPTLVAQWETPVAPDVAVVQEEVTVTTNGPLDGGVLALESRFDAEIVRVALPGGWGGSEPATHLATASSVPIPVPDRCHDGPCTFTFDTLAQFLQPQSADSNRRPAPTVDWTVTATSPLEADVASSPASIPQVATQAGLGRIVLDGAEVVDGVRFVVTLPPLLLPGDEWPPGLADDVHVEDTPNRPAQAGRAAGVGPAVMLELRPDGVLMTGEELDRPPGLGMRLLVVGPDAGSYLGVAGWSEQQTSPDQWGPWRTALPNACLPDRPCDIELELQAAPRYFEPPDGDHVIAFDLDVEVAVLLPWTASPSQTPSEAPTIRIVTDAP